MGTTFVLVSKTSAGPVSGSFAGRPEGSVFTASGSTWQISYTGGDGNDVAITTRAARRRWRRGGSLIRTTQNAASRPHAADPDNDGESNFSSLPQVKIRMP